MAGRRDLEARVAQLGSEVARLRGRGFRGVRYRSSLALGEHVMRPGRGDPEAEVFFSRYGLEGLCRGQGRAEAPPR